MRRMAPVFALAVCLLVASSCDDEMNPIGLRDQYPFYPKSPEELVTEYLPYAYSHMDSTAYATLLDSKYVFQLAGENPDPTVPPDEWDLSEEMAIAGIMFNARPNGVGQQTAIIDLKMTEKNMVVDATDYPDKPAGETWYEFTAIVDLNVLVSGPHKDTPYIVNSDQVFVVRPDPDPTRKGGWIVYKQIDQKPINKGASGAGTQESSWGAVKEMFR